jgi:hypothetical protein
MDATIFGHETQLHVSTKEAMARRRTGRPTKFCAEIVTKLCEHISEGVPFDYCAALCGLSPATFHAWRQKYPRFDEAVREAIGRGVAARLKTISEASITDWRAASWLLEHCQPEHFAKTRIQVEAVGQFDHAFVIPQQTLDQIAETRGKHERDLTNGASSLVLAEPPSQNKIPDNTTP